MNFTDDQIKNSAENIGIDILKYDMDEVRKGIHVELEHGKKGGILNVTDDDPDMTLKIALAHLNEVPDYYTKLEKYVEPKPTTKTEESVSDNKEEEITQSHKIKSFDDYFKD